MKFLDILLQRGIVGALNRLSVIDFESLLPKNGNTFFIQNPQSIGLPHFVENVQEIGLAPRPKDHRKRPYFSILGDGKQHTGQGAPDQMKKHVFHREIESLLFRTLHGVFDDRAVLFGVEDQTVADFETLFEKVGDFSDLSEVDFV